MSEAKDSTSEQSKPSPSSQDISYILELFKYRNIAWRYLLCYCLPLQQKILIKQLRIAHDRKSSLSAIRKESLESQKKATKSSKNIFDNISSLFEDNDEKKDINSDEDDDIPDFYHLPRISLNELQTLFKEGRQKYELLKKIYITDKQQAIRNEMMRVTAPPSEQYNDPSLRTRSNTITELIERENTNSKQTFTRIDLINDDWESQDKMNKLAQLRSAPPTYSPPKPPKPLPFISQEQHRHNFHADSRKNSRSRFNSFSAENLNIAKLHMGKNKKKKKKNASDIFKMKVFQSKSHSHSLNDHGINDENDDPSQAIQQILNTALTQEEMPETQRDRGRSKRRFSERLPQSATQSPFAALSYTRKKNKKIPQTPPPKKSDKSVMSLSDLSAMRNKAFKHKTPSFLPITKPLKRKKKGNKIRSRSPLSMLLGGRKKKIESEKAQRFSLKNPSLSLEAEDYDGLLNQQDDCFSDHSLNGFISPEKHPNRSLSLSVISTMKRQRSLSEDNVKYIYNKKQPISASQDTETDSKSETNLDITQNVFQINSGSLSDQSREFSGNKKLHMLPDDDENDEEVLKQLEDDIIKQIETEKSTNSTNETESKIINVIEDDGDSNSDDIGTLLNATIIDYDDHVITSNDDNEMDQNNNNTNSIETESLVVAAPLHKDRDGTIILNKPSGSAPPVEHDIMMANERNNNKQSIHASLSQINKKGLMDSNEFDFSATPNKNNNSQSTSPSSPIVIQLSNTDDVNVVEQYFSDSERDKEPKRHRETIVMQTEHKNESKTSQIEAENRIAKSLEDVFDNNNTKPGLFSDSSNEEYVNINNDINDKHSPSCSIEQSFGEIVVNHPLCDEPNQAITFTQSLPNAMTPTFTNSAVSHDTSHRNNTHLERKESYKRQRKRGQRPNTMISGFTPHFLKGVHNVHEIDEKENKDLWKQIMKDVNRTFQYRDFFRKKETRYCLGNLLYIWSRINHKIGYLQGMHDLASIVTMAIYFDYKIFNDVSDDEMDSNDSNHSQQIQDDNSTLEHLLDPKYLEHDIYAIYDALLQLTVKFFEQAVPPMKDENEHENENKNETSDTAHLNRGLFDSGSNCSLYLKLHYLHHKLLKHFDLTLYTHFESIGLSPQLYMLRWIRVIFSREFYLDQIIRLWDELFVSENLIEFIDYIVMAMINNVRQELLLKKDMTIIALLQNYPKQETTIGDLATTARRIQKGQIKFDFVSSNKELYSQIASSDKMRDYSQESKWLFQKDIRDYETFPNPNASTTSVNNISDENYYHYLNGPDIRIPGFGEITPTQKYLVKKIIHNNYGTKMQICMDEKNKNKQYIRMGYLVKRGAGDQSIFARRNLKIRWFVIDKNKKISYYKNKKAYNKNEDALRNPIKLKGRAIRVVDAKYYCFEISGINVSKRAYLLWAKDFTDFVLWLHVLMWCADKSLYEAM